MSDERTLTLAASGLRAAVDDRRLDKHLVEYIRETRPVPRWVRRVTTA